MHSWWEKDLHTPIPHIVFFITEGQVNDYRDRFHLFDKEELFCVNAYRKSIMLFSYSLHGVTEKWKAIIVPVCTLNPDGSNGFVCCLCR